MKELFRINRWMTSSDMISDCAKGLKDLNRLKQTYPSQTEEAKTSLINLKA